MKQPILILCTLVLQIAAFAQVNIYDSRTLSPELTKGASSVKRMEVIKFTINSAGSGNYKMKQVITVLDANGKDELDFYQYSDKFRHLVDAEIKVYDATGKELNKYRQREMKTTAPNQEHISDDKITYFTVSTASYPVTVDVEYEVSFSGFFQYESYKIQKPGQAIEQSQFIVSVPPELDIRYKPMNTLLTPVISQDEKNKSKIYTWAASKLQAKNPENGAGNLKSYFPWILIAPNQVNFQGYAGQLSTWKDMGLWYNNLVKDIAGVPDIIRETMQKVVGDAKTDGEKARRIYSYLQKNFRYVSIQLGIGGLKPFPATYVHNKKYGDCKALSNYMQTCLQAVDIKSYNAWITSDPYPPLIDPNFAYDPFNHQILCIPSGKDTTWLECTSTTSDFGVLGSNTENRYALLLKENGGVLVKTPSSKSSNNTFNTRTNVELSEDASGKLNTVITGKGEYKEQLYAVSKSPADRQKNYFVRYLEFPSSDENSTTFGDEKNHEMTARLDMEVEKIPGFTAGNKMFLNPRSYAIWQYSMPEGEKRMHDFYFDHPFDKSDSTVYHLPADFFVESIPKARDIKFEYGNFKTSYAFDKEAKTITTTARLVLNTQQIPASKYLAARKFFSDVLEEFTDKIVVRKN
ncbi:MAG: DUF3857 domain-containing protein [Chitinophagaceae bacterium]